MDFRTFCTHKGCGKEMRPVVDKETLVAYCTECAKPVDTISIFMRRQMVANGQVRKNEKKKMAWSVHCKSCQKDSPPKLDKDGNKLLCSFCDEELDVSKPFAQMLKVNLVARRRADGE